MSVEISTIVAGAERLGEGAVWDTEDQRLWWVDITGGLIHCYNPEDKSNQSFAFGEPVGCIARRENGGLVVAAKSGFWFFDPHTGQKRHIIDPEKDQPENRFNDGTVDPAGRFWAGTMKDGGEPKQKGKFYLLETDLKLTEMDKLFYTTNGLAFSPNGDTIYFSDSNKLTRTIWSCNYDSATGLTGKAKTFFDTRQVDGRPDGGTVDAEGCYWMAGVSGWQIIRISPEGELLFTLDVPVEKPTKPMFGGKNLDILYLTSIGFGLTEGSEANQPDAGGLFAIKGLGVTGLRQPRFKG